MNSQDLQLTSNIMQRVHTVHAMRTMWASQALKGSLFLACCVAATYLISIPSVIQNVMSVPGIIEGAAYLTTAFLHTSVTVQGVLCVALVVGGWLFVDFMRTMKGSGYHLSILKSQSV